MAPSRRRKRYFVKCGACDQTFWLDHKVDPVPEHGPWNRRVDSSPHALRGCTGEGKPGHWIGEESVGPFPPWGDRPG